MNINYNKLKKQLILHEGYSTKPYPDSEELMTIGIGHCIDRNPLPRSVQEYLKLHGEITDEMVNIIFNMDIQKVIGQVEAKLPWIAVHDEVRTRVLIDMAFNLGIHGLLEFVNTLKFVKAKNYTQAAQNMLKSKWARQVKGRAIRLAKMMATGKDYAA